MLRTDKAYAEPRTSPAPKSTNGSTGVQGPCWWRLMSCGADGTSSARAGHEQSYRTPRVPHAPATLGLPPAPVYRYRVSRRLGPCRAIADHQTGSAAAGNRTEVQTQDDHAQVDELQSRLIADVQQQSAATAPYGTDSMRPSSASGLRQRPLSTALPLDGKEEVHQHGYSLPVRGLEQSPVAEHLGIQSLNITYPYPHQPGPNSLLKRGVSRLLREPLAGTTVQTLPGTSGHLQPWFSQFKRMSRAQGAGGFFGLFSPYKREAGGSNPPAPTNVFAARWPFLKR